MKTNEKVENDVENDPALCYLKTHYEDNTRIDYYRCQELKHSAQQLKSEFFSEITQFLQTVPRGEDIDMGFPSVRKKFIKFYIASKFDLNKLLQFSLSQNYRFISEDDINLLLFNGASYDYLTEGQQVKACNSLLTSLTFDPLFLLLNFNTATFSKFTKNLTSQQTIALGKKIIQFYNAINSDLENDLELVKALLQMNTLDDKISFYIPIFGKLLIKQNPQLLQLVNNNLKLAVEENDDKLIIKILSSASEKSLLDSPRAGEKKLIHTLYTTTLDAVIEEGNISLLQKLERFLPKNLVNVLNGTNVIDEQSAVDTLFLINAVINSDKSDKHLKFLETLLSIKGVDINKGIVGITEQTITPLLFSIHQHKTKAFELLMKCPNLTAKSEILEAITQIDDENTQESMFEIFLANNKYLSNKFEQLQLLSTAIEDHATLEQVVIKFLGDYFNNDIESL